MKSRHTGQGWCCYLALVVVYSTALPTLEAAQPDQTRQTLLLVDDHHVLYRPGTMRILRPLDREPENPVILADRPWEQLISYCSVYRDSKDGRYQLWYQAYPGCHLCYATSEDGVRWTKPRLGLVEYEGSTDNNIVMPIGYGASVVVDPRDPDPTRRYKAAFWDSGEIEGHQIPGTCVAFSPDGIHWTLHDGNPVIRGSHGHYIQPPFASDPRIKTGKLGGPPLSTSDVTDAIWDPMRNTFAIYAKTWIDGPDGTMHWKRAVVRTESSDFIDWSKPRLMMAPDEFDDWQGDAVEVQRTSVGGGSGGRQLHSGPVFVYNNVYLSLLQVMDAGKTGRQPIELAVSRNGLDWQRPFREAPFLPTAPGDQFDSGRIWSNATPIILAEQVRFYYGGYRGRWNMKGPIDDHKPSAIGLATMPRDRFAGVQPMETIGQITLKAIDLSNCRNITLNADAIGGSIRVEVLNSQGYRVRGFSKEDAEPIKGDSLSHDVRWNNRTVLDLADGFYLLRLHLDQATVYALTLSNP